MPQDVKILLLHGAGTGAWVWERVIRELPAAAIALDIQGRSTDATPDSCVRNVLSDLDRQGVESVVIVMHSLAGVLAPGLLKALGSRVRQLVYVSGVIPPPGGAFVDALGLANRLVLKTLFKFNPEGLKPSPAMIRRELCNDLSEEDADMIVSRYEPEMPGLYLMPVEGPPAHDGCVYVKLLQDRSVAPSRQDKMIARLRDPLIHEVESGHLVMLSKPGALAEIVAREAARP